MSAIPNIGDTQATCAECGCIEEYRFPLEEERWRRVLAVEFRWLCNDCWHRAREKQQPFRIIRNDGYAPGNVYLEYECVDFMQQHPVWYRPTTRWRIEPAPCWYGDRVAHPGYMAKRRTKILAEYAQ